MQKIIAYPNLTYPNPHLSEPTNLIVNIITCLRILSYVVMNIIGAVHCLNHLHLIHLSELFAYPNKIQGLWPQGFG